GGAQAVPARAAKGTKVHRDLKKSFWPKNLARVIANKKEYARWKKQSDKIRRPKNFKARPPFIANKLHGTYRPVPSAWNFKKAHAMFHPKRLDSDLRAVQSKLLNVSYAAAYVADFIQHRSADPE